jgi:SET domain-containing protein
MQSTPEPRGFLVPVELRFINEKIGHGVFSLGFIPKGTPLWIPALVSKISCDDLPEILNNMTPDTANEYLRQGFVLASDLQHLCVNINDLGRFVNHSNDANCGYAEFTTVADASVALRDIKADEEITCNYSGLGSPLWYKELCRIYNVTPTDEVVLL